MSDPVTLAFKVMAFLGKPFLVVEEWVWCITGMAHAYVVEDGQVPWCRVCGHVVREDEVL